MVLSAAPDRISAPSGDTAQASALLPACAIAPLAASPAGRQRASQIFSVAS